MFNILTIDTIKYWNNNGSFKLLWFAAAIIPGQKAKQINQKINSLLDIYFFPRLA